MPYGIFQRNNIKEVFDNLPSGICFFSENGIPVLCNRKMDAIVFLMTGKDLQLITDLTEVLAHPEEYGSVEREGDNFVLSDGSVWRFSVQSIQTDGNYTEILATDVTDLYQKKKELDQSTKEHERMVQAMREIVNNVEDITREEEILSLKMQIHSDIGIALQKLRRFHAGNCPREEKKHLISDFEQVIHLISESSDDSEDSDAFAEVFRVAASLGVTVEMIGEVPTARSETKPILLALQECITNAIRHAGGTHVTVRISVKRGLRTVEITNNGTQPEKPVVEGGGLSSLRRKIEKSGGSMYVESIPEFLLRLILPVRGEVKS